MSGTRGLSRKRRHILTTVFVVVAVIAAMINVPWMKANAREAAPSFEPNLTLGNNETKNGKSGTDPNYGFLVWAGEPAQGKTKPNSENNVGWAWCLEPEALNPYNTERLYDHANAEQLSVSPEYRDAAINVAGKLQNAAMQNNSKEAVNYYVYLATLLGDKDLKQSLGLSQKVFASTITGSRAHSRSSPVEWCICPF